MTGKTEPRRWLVQSLGAALIGATLLSGCSTSAPVSAVSSDQEFVAWFIDLGEDIKADPNYNRMPIDTAAQGDEFSSRLHQAYRGETTKAQFAQWASTTYPGHAYEVAFVTQRLP